MHKLERPDAPECLNKLYHARKIWRDVSKDDKQEIWKQLDKMQCCRCAYCESYIMGNGERNAHIEHFRQRSNYPQGTFEWENLFGSCNREESCGRHKDRNKLFSYKPEDLIKADVDDPDHFFVFCIDGSITIRSDISSEQRHRAEETLRVFNLDHPKGALRHMRKAAVQGYITTAEEIVEMALNFDESEWLPILEQELQAITELPFTTAIRHTLLPC